MVRKILFCPSCTHPCDCTGVYSSSSASALRACGTGGVGFLLLLLTFFLPPTFTLYTYITNYTLSTLFHACSIFHWPARFAFISLNSFYSFSSFYHSITALRGVTCNTHTKRTNKHNLNRLWAHRSPRVQEEEEEEEREEKKKRATFIR